LFEIEMRMRVRRRMKLDELRHFEAARMR